MVSYIRTVALFPT